jgi:hypothetical protein
MKPNSPLSVVNMPIFILYYETPSPVKKMTQYDHHPKSCMALGALVYLS